MCIWIRLFLFWRCIFFKTLGDQYVQGTQWWNGIATNIMHGQIQTPNDQTLTSFRGCVMNWWIFFHYQKWYILLSFDYFNALKELLVWWWRRWKFMLMIGWPHIMVMNNIWRNLIGGYHKMPRTPWHTCYNGCI